MEAPARGLDKKQSSLMFIQITPPHGWEQDPQSHYLRLTLPGFEAKDITINMDKHGQLVVRGVRQISEHKHMSFEETFEVPNDANLEDAEGQFEDDQIYCITIPKSNELRERRGHQISMPKEETRPVVKKDSSIHKYAGPDSKQKPERSPSQRIPNKPLDVIKNEDKSKKLGFMFFIALIIALLVVTVVLIVKFHRR